MGTLVCEGCGWRSERFCEGHHATRGLFIIYQSTLNRSFRQFRLHEFEPVREDGDFSADASANAIPNEVFSNLTEDEANGARPTCFKCPNCGGSLNWNTEGFT